MTFNTAVSNRRKDWTLFSWESALEHQKMFSRKDVGLYFSSKCTEACQGQAFNFYECVAIIHHLMHVTEVLILFIIPVMAPVAECQLRTVCKN